MIEINLFNYNQKHIMKHNPILELSFFCKDKKIIIIKHSDCVEFKKYVKKKICQAHKDNN